MEMAHRLGMRTTATMMFGHVETLEERIDHLLHLRELQDRTAASRPSSPGPSSPRTPRSPARSSPRSSTCARWPSPA
jgi:cyclic dehypoxanthinyl futalosine synthase